MPDKTQRPVIHLLTIDVESHVHPTNKMIYFICVSAIVFCLLGVIWASHPMAAWATAALPLAYCFALSTPIAWDSLLATKLRAISPRFWPIFGFR